MELSGAESAPLGLQQTHFPAFYGCTSNSDSHPEVGPKVGNAIPWRQGRRLTTGSILTRGLNESGCDLFFTYKTLISFWVGM